MIPYPVLNRLLRGIADGAGSQADDTQRANENVISIGNDIDACTDSKENII